MPDGVDDPSTPGKLAQRSFCAQVVRTGDSIDPTTRTLLTEVDVPNASGTFLPGACAEVHFDVKVTGQRLSLPVNALLIRLDGTRRVRQSAAQDAPGTATPRTALPSKP